MFVFMLIITALITTSFTVKCLATSSMTSGVKIAIFLVVLLAWFSPIYTCLIVKLNFFSIGIAGWIHNLGFYCFGFAFILFSVLMIRNLVWFVGYYIARLAKLSGAEAFNPANIDLMNKANVITFIFALLLSFYAVYEAVKIPKIKTVEIKTSKVTKPVKFALLTDIHIHNGTQPKRIKMIVDTTNTLNPDAVLLAGDTGDGNATKSAHVTKELQGFKSTFGTFLVHGNHELYQGMKEWQDSFEKNNISVLNNQGQLLGDTNIYLAGVLDASFERFKAYKPDSAKALSQAPKDSYRLLMAHSPLRENKSADPLPNAPFDLQVSGHTHGGQIFPFNLLAKPANKYLAGLYDITDNSKIYVSRGTGYWGPPMRLFSPSEITLITLLPE